MRTLPWPRPGSPAVPRSIERGGGEARAAMPTGRNRHQRPACPILMADPNHARGETCPAGFLFSTGPQPRPRLGFTTAAAAPRFSPLPHAALTGRGPRPGTGPAHPASNPAFRATCAPEGAAPLPHSAGVRAARPAPPQPPPPLRLPQGGSCEGAARGTPGLVVPCWGGAPRWGGR